jgi:hypothetical protein
MRRVILKQVLPRSEDYIKQLCALYVHNKDLMTTVRDVRHCMMYWEMSMPVWLGDDNAGLAGRCQWYGREM